MDILNSKELFADMVDFKRIPPESFLVGMISELNNRIQSSGDKMFGELSWKQEFTLSCLSLFLEPPTIKDLADFLGSSHQNVKQVLIKLEKNGFIKMEQDEADHRKIRVRIIPEVTNPYFKKYMPVMRENDAKLFAEVTEEELTTTIRTLSKMHKYLVSTEN